MCEWVQSLCEQLAHKLRSKGLNPAIVPCGGASPLGAWGYLQCAQELAIQYQHQRFTDIVLVCLHQSPCTTAAWLASLLVVMQHNARVST